MPSLRRLLVLTLTSHLHSVLAAPTILISDTVMVGDDEAQAKIERRFAPGMCHIDIQRDEYPRQDEDMPFWLKAQVFDAQYRETGDLQWTRCHSRDGVQACTFWSGLDDEITLAPIYTKGSAKHKEIKPERDYVHVTLGNHTSFPTDNYQGNENHGGRAHCVKTRDTRDSSVTKYAWTCNFQCFRRIDAVMDPGQVNNIIQEGLKPNP